MFGKTTHERLAGWGLFFLITAIVFSSGELLAQGTTLKLGWSWGADQNTDLWFNKQSDACVQSLSTNTQANNTAIQSAAIEKSIPQCIQDLIAKGNSRFGGHGAWGIGNGSTSTGSSDIYTTAISSGTLTLTGTMKAAGQATFSGGILQFGGSILLPLNIDPSLLKPAILTRGSITTGTVNVGTGSTIVVQGGCVLNVKNTTGSIFTGTGILNVADTIGSSTPTIVDGGSVTCEGTLSLDSGCIVRANNIPYSGTLTINSGSIDGTTLITNTVSTGTLNVGTGSTLVIGHLNTVVPSLLDLQPVPEPSTLVLLISASACLAAVIAVWQKCRR